VLDDKTLKEILVSESYVSKDDMAKADQYATANQLNTVDLLLEQKTISDETLGQAIAEYFAVPFTDSELLPDKEVVMKLPESFVRKYHAALYKETEKEFLIVTDEPKASGLLTAAGGYLKKKKIVISYGQAKGIDACLLFYRKPLSERFATVLKSDKPIAPQLLYEIFIEAITVHASDIHFEPQEKDALIRLRVDGLLRDASRIDHENYTNIINLVKVQANVKIDDHFSAQDGSIRFEDKDNIVDMRVSIVPTVDGEKIVLRLLSHYVKGLSLSDVGLLAEDQAIIEAAAKKPFGMILVTGPTGSGKTTTLYSLLKLLNRKDVNITTIEDPVEYRIAGTNQIQVNTQTNLTFAKGIRSIVRQDPDIILVGEIRDTETAEVAVNAALTGHLLLSTFHANDAASAYPRLLDMKIEPFLMASTLDIIIAQRLVRLICPNCRHSKSYSKANLDKIDSHVSKYFSHAETTLYEGKGCKACNNTGFQGRTGIFEIIQVTKEMKELLMTRPPSENIANLSKKQGGKTMFDDGVRKVVLGITTLNELLRVANPSE
jgi:type II secretory ATPase GspE/PulE/Tfp pilus assembly ATPase PilB-like protein